MSSEHSIQMSNITLKVDGVVVGEAKSATAILSEGEEVEIPKENLHDMLGGKSVSFSITSADFPTYY